LPLRLFGGFIRILRGLELLLQIGQRSGSEGFDVRVRSALRVVAEIPHLGFLVFELLRPRDSDLYRRGKCGKPMGD
jgi:hypothetical protein